MLEREGEGWRLAWDGQRHPFPLLIGGEGWASELTALEASALAKAMGALREQHHSLVDSLMEEESITLEFEGPTQEGVGTLWMALEGDRREWTLRFVLQPGQGRRGLEGGWSRRAADPFARACCDLLGQSDPLDPHQLVIDQQN